MTTQADDYTFENGSKPTKPDFVDPDYTFENGEKPLSEAVDCAIQIERASRVQPN